MNTGKNFVFLLGAGRSGTTLLYKLLSAHRDIAYLSSYQNRWPAWPSLALMHRLLNHFPEFKREAWFKKEGGAYFNERRAWQQFIIPTPTEAEPIYQSCGLPLTPDSNFQPNYQLAACLNAKFERIRILTGAKVLLTKRTANNRRISALTHIFPAAKYIHLVRDGRAVAYSLPRVAWWDDHMLYWAGKTPKQMVSEGADPLMLAATNWVEEMKSLEAGLPLIESARLLEVRYEKLLENPLEEIRRMVEFIGLGVRLPDQFRQLVESLQLKPRAESWCENWSDEEKWHVNEVQSAILQRWGYVNPVGASLE